MYFYKTISNFQVKVKIIATCNFCNFWKLIVMYFIYKINVDGNGINAISTDLMTSETRLINHLYKVSPSTVEYWYFLLEYIVC